MNIANNCVQTAPKYMTPNKFAEYTGIPIRLVREMLKSGELTGFKSGRTNYILVESYTALAHPMTTK